MAMILTVFPAAAFAADEEKNFSRDEQISELLDILLDGIIGDVSSFNMVPSYKLRSIEKYVALGDSTATGYGLEGLSIGDSDFDYHYGYGTASDGKHHEGSFGVEDGAAFTLLLSDKLGIKRNAEICTAKEGEKTCGAKLYLDCTRSDNHFAQLGMGYLRAEDFFTILKYTPKQIEEYNAANDFDTYFEQYIYNSLISKVASHGTAFESSGEAMLKMKEDYIKNIKAADLITLSLGGNNLGNYVRFLMEDGNGEAQINYELSKYFPNTKLLDSALDAMNSLMAKAGIDLSNVKVAGMDPNTLLVKYLLYAYVSTCLNNILAADEIHRLNKDAVIVLMGQYNPLDDLLLNIGDGNLKIKVGKLANLITDSVNRVLKRYAMAHPLYACYVDVSEPGVIVDSYGEISVQDMIDGKVSMAKLFGGDFGAALHQSKSGHEYMAEQVYRTLYRKNFGLFR